MSDTYSLWLRPRGLSHLCHTCLCHVNSCHRSPFCGLESNGEKVKPQYARCLRFRFAILASYLRGPAFQVIRAVSSDRNGFAVWHRLKSLYAPRARPRALAIGQAIMQHPGFPNQKTMLENLLNFDALLDLGLRRKDARRPCCEHSAEVH